MHSNNSSLINPLVFKHFYWRQIFEYNIIIFFRSFHWDMIGKFYHFQWMYYSGGLFIVWGYRKREWVYVVKSINIYFSFSLDEIFHMNSSLPSPFTLIIIRRYVSFSQTDQRSLPLSSVFIVIFLKVSFRKIFCNLLLYNLTISQLRFVYLMEL